MSTIKLISDQYEFRILDKEESVQKLNEDKRDTDKENIRLTVERDRIHRDLKFMKDRFHDMIKSKDATINLLKDHNTLLETTKEELTKALTSQLDKV